MADVSKIKLGATTYNIKDEGAARTSHTHPTSIATSTGTSELTMSHGSKYALTAGGDSFIFTLPADSNTDTKVTQTATTTPANYEVLFSATADNTNRTEGARKSANLLFNPNTGALTFGNATTAQLISKTPSRTAAFLTIGGSKKTAGDANGTAVRLGAGGATFIGGGEYPDNRYNVADIADGDENLYMGADGIVYIETNAQTIGSRKTFTFGSDGTFNSPSTIKQNGTAVSLSNHTHATSIATSTGTSQITLAHGGKYALTAGGTSYIFTLPADSNTDTKVTQTASSGNANYEVLFSATADNTTRTEGACKNNNLTFNPSTGNLQATKFNGYTLGPSVTHGVETTINAQSSSSSNLITASAAVNYLNSQAEISIGTSTPADTYKLWIQI